MSANSKLTKRNSSWRSFACFLFVVSALSGCGLGLCLDRCKAGGLVPASVIPLLNLTPKWRQLDASWVAAEVTDGYLLLRSAGSQVSWLPVDGQVYAAGQTVSAGHLVVHSGIGTSASDTLLNNSVTYHYRVFSYNSAYQYTAGASAAGAPAGISCPANYLAVGPNADVQVSAPFCIAKYEMKNDGSSNAVSQIAGTPWVSITRVSATTRCQLIGPGYDLISNAQWQAAAREIELAENTGIFLNWSNGSPSGSNALNQGHSDMDPNNALAASLDSDPCFGTNNVNCDNNAHPDFVEKRTHFLSSGEVIWDMGGNISEWVKDSIVAGPPYEGGSNYISQQPWTSDLNRPEKWGPFGNYLSKNSGQYGGLGYAELGFSAGAVFRGGYWYGSIQSGIFSADLTYGAGISWPEIGFRCVVVP